MGRFALMIFPRLHRKLLARIAGTAGVLYFVWLPCGLELPPPKPSLDMPVSLALGTVRSPEFPVKRAKYEILLRAENGHMPYAEQACLMGVSPAYSKCNTQSVLQADWSIRDGAAISEQGSTPLNASSDVSNHFLDRELGQFTGNRKSTTFSKSPSPKTARP